MWPSGKVRTMAAEKRSMIPRGLWRERGEQVRRGFFGFYNGRLITIHSSQPLEYETQRLGSTQWIWGENVSLNVASLVVRSVSHSGGMFLRLKGDGMCGGNVGTVWPFHATLLQTKNCSKTKPFIKQKRTSSTVVSSFTVTKYLTQTTQRRRDLFWFMVSEVPVHSWLVPLLGAIVEVKQHGGRMWWRKPLTSWQLENTERGKDRRREGQGPDVVYMVTLLGSSPFNQGPLPQSTLPSLMSPKFIPSGG